jgi:hypothetical protein
VGDPVDDGVPHAHDVDPVPGEFLVRGTQTNLR